MGSHIPNDAIYLGRCTQWADVQLPGQLQVLTRQLKVAQVVEAAANAVSELGVLVVKALTLLIGGQCLLVQPPRLGDGPGAKVLLPCLLLLFAQTLAVLGLERGKVFEVGWQGSEHDLDVALARHGHHPLQIVAVVGVGLLALQGLARVAFQPGALIEDGADLVLQHGRFVSCVAELLLHPFDQRAQSGIER